MRRTIFGTSLLLLALSAPALAQEAPSGRVSLEPYVGAFKDAYDISPDGNDLGARAGLRIGYPVGGRLRLVADASYATSGNVSDPQTLGSYFVYDNTWALTTVGAEYDVLAGGVDVALGLRAGAGWRRVDFAGQVGEPSPQPRSQGGFSPIDVLVPTLSIRREILPRATAVVSLEHHVFDVLEGPTDHSPGLTIGLSLR